MLYNDKSINRPFNYFTMRNKKSSIIDNVKKYTKVVWNIVSNKSLILRKK